MRGKCSICGMESIDLHFPLEHEQCCYNCAIDLINKRHSNKINIELSEVELFNLTYIIEQFDRTLEGEYNSSLSESYNNLDHGFGIIDLVKKLNIIYENMKVKD